jgi:hypothetical protein
MQAVPSMGTAAGPPAPKASPRGARKLWIVPFALQEKLAKRSLASAAPARYFCRFAAIARRSERRQESGVLPPGRDRISWAPSSHRKPSALLIGPSHSANMFMEAFLCCKMASYPYFALMQRGCLYIYTYIDTVIILSVFLICS